MDWGMVKAILFFVAAVAFMKYHKVIIAWVKEKLAKKEE